MPLGDIQIEMLGYSRTSNENDDFNKPENHDTHIGPNASYRWKHLLFILFFVNSF